MAGSSPAKEVTWSCWSGDEAFSVYILASQRNGTLYIGVTNNLLRRVCEHKKGLQQGFGKRYRVNILVHYEVFDSISLAIQRETNLKKWPREWKLNLIEQDNPQWRDLYHELQ
ncbi:MAG: GIY-YIG nuclease family protein [Hyphomicrobiaceae bacterium]|nr:GIY-YIG nuclease family protein [Hyphomicrobiaceae bacterium]